MTSAAMTPGDWHPGASVSHRPSDSRAGPHRASALLALSGPLVVGARPYVGLVTSVMSSAGTDCSRSRFRRIPRFAAGGRDHDRPTATPTSETHPYQTHD